VTELAPWLRHELKAPLAVISGYLELLEDDLDPLDRRDAMRRVSHAAAVLAELIDDVGAWVLVETSQLGATADRRAIRLDDVAGGFVDQVEASHPRVIVGVEGDLAGIGDPDYLRHALRLIVAAVDVAAPREAGPEVIVTAVGSRLVIAVDGAGLGATELAGLEPGARTSSRASRMLALAGELVRAQGGAIEGSPHAVRIDLPAGG
jgi:signal transduction histidine kinase